MGFEDALNGVFADPANMTGVTGGVQMFILLLAYGYVLAVAASLISEGSELLLLVPSLTGTVGSIVLPVRPLHKHALSPVCFRNWGGVGARCDADHAHVRAC